MKTLHAESDRRAVVDRVERLAPDATPHWGTMSAPRMVVHITDVLRMATGELAVKSVNAPFRFPIIKQLVIYVLPIPKNLPTAPELIARSPGEWSDEVAQCLAMLERFAAKGVDTNWGVHPAFGPMTGTQWGIQAFTHLDHHLRQFGT